MYTLTNNIVFSILFLSSTSTLISQIPTLSQNSNYFIYKSSINQYFISSRDGLNIYNGRTNRIYRPSNSNMIGSNIQSEFFEDSRGYIWFTTYVALHGYNPVGDNFETFQFTDFNNDLIEVDYQVIHQEKDTIWIQAGEMTILFNTRNKTKIRSFCSDVADFHAFFVQRISSDRYQIVAADAGIQGIKVITFNNNFSRINTKSLQNFSVYGLCRIDDCQLIVTSFYGEYLIYNHCTQTIIDRNKICSTGIHKIELIDNNRFKFYSDKSGVFIYDIKLHEKVEILYEPNDFDLGDKKMIECNTLPDNYLMACIEGEGIMPINLRARSLFFSKVDKIFQEKGVLKCIYLPSGLVFISTISEGVFIFDIGRTILIEIPYFSNSAIDAATLYLGKIVFSIDNKLYEIDQNNNCKIINPIEQSNFNYIDRMTTINNRVFCRVDDFQLAELIIDNGKYKWDRSPIENLNGFNITNFCGINNERLILSVNNEYVLHYRINEDFSPELLHKHNIKGELKDVLLFKDSSILVSTSDGLYRIESSSINSRKVTNISGLLNQTIYAIKSDSKGNLWLSSNSGILKYNPTTEEVYQFGLKHGIQGLEYNTGAHLQTEDGHILFGGMKGLDYFHPDSITLSDYKSPIYFSSFLVNEEPYPEQTAQTLDTVILPFNQNTLTFGFHAIDYTDPQNTLTKYKLVGKDNEYSKETSADGSARYSNLDPGEYVFTVMGTNADHVWNPTPRTLHITILPPWYATWWARSLGIFLIGGLTYFTIRSYYKRQIREKDLALREANLTISQQKVLSEERTRIAAEMHDDLGGGLTSIRFLSQKVLRSVTNEGLKTQVSKIVNLSEGLVSNMSEIIWAMDAGFDSLTSLISYVRRYAHEYLEDYNIDLSFKFEGKSTVGIPLSGNQRRNIFLVIKEAIHNTVKHSDANKLSIQFKVEENLKIEIVDNGIGLQGNDVSGNGLKNMNRRVQVLGGNIKIVSKDGLNIKIQVPLN